MMRMRIPRMDNKGVALVEFAIIALVLLTLAIGIVDFGLLMKDHLALSNGVREGAREASLGGAPDEIKAKVIANAPTPNLQDGETLTVTVKFHEWLQDDWGEWTDLEDISGTSKVEARIKAEYRCNRVSGTFLGTNPITLGSQLIVKRE